MDRHEEKKLEKIIGSSLRRHGLVFPKTESELDDMVESLDPDPIPEELVENICSRIVGKENITIQISKEAISNVGEQPSQNNTETNNAFKAAARNKGNINKEEQQKLESDRQKLDKNSEQENQLD